MGSLTIVEKRKFESLLSMSNGYVLQLQKSELISMIVAATGHRPPEADHPVPPSRAKILRQFWDTAKDSQVADVLSQLVDCFEQESSSNDLTRSQALVANCREVIKRLATPTHQPSRLEAFMNVGDMEGIQKALNRIRSSVDSDPDLAIGSSKELIESVCKTILDDRSVVIKDSIGFTELTREAFSTLSLTPDNISQTTRAADEVKRMLANLNSIVRQIEAIRDLYGTGHGRHAKAKGLQPRHARLVSGCAEVLCIFLWESHTRKKP
jgi:hypothetical protein